MLKQSPQLFPMQLMQLVYRQLIKSALLRQEPSKHLFHIQIVTLLVMIVLGQLRTHLKM